MDITLQEIIRKHAEKQGISYEEGVKIYNDYNRELNLKVDDVLNNNIKEIRVPHVLRFVFNNKRYEIYKKGNKDEFVKTGESELESGPDILDNDSVCGDD